VCEAERWERRFVKRWRTSKGSAMAEAMGVGAVDLWYGWFGNLVELLAQLSLSMVCARVLL